MFFASTAARGGTAAGVLFGFTAAGRGDAGVVGADRAFFRYSSLASLVAAVFAPFYQLLIWGADATFGAIAAMCALLVWRHQGNIRKLLAGTESKLGQKAKIT